MGKPKMLGYQKPYKPNNRADFRNRKRGWNPVNRIKPTKEVASNGKGRAESEI